MAFMAWPEIEAFYNIRKYTSAHPEIVNGNSVVEYRSKIKIHGTNAAIQWTPEGDIVCQSRSGIITPDNDNAGFARWVEENKAEFHRSKWSSGIIIYGEWCGKGIQKNVAISEISQKVFAIFAARSMKPGNDVLIVEPNELQHLVDNFNVPGLHILPWHTRPVVGTVNAPVVISIDWQQTSEELAVSTAQINEWVAVVEENDPWVEKTFGIKGTGEGLVFYPVSKEHLGAENFKNLTFKAKGEKHKNIKTAAPAQVNPEVAVSVDAFVEMVLAPARLEQGARAIVGEHKHENSLSCIFCTTSEPQFDMKLTGKFVSWVLSDVQKETIDELEASGLDWKQVEKPLTNKARSWYLEQAKK